MESVRQMSEAQPNLKFINRDLLKILAMSFMLLDHLWATIIPGNQWLTFIGRMAFPLFAFMIAEGFVHTSNFRKYALRLLVFALISEIPFNLFYSSSVFYPFHQNVIFTLLIGLLAIKVIDIYLQKRTPLNLVYATLAAVGLPLLAEIAMTDYGAIGVMTVIVFYLFRNMRYTWLLQLIALFILNVVIFQGFYIPIEILGQQIEFPTQGFAVFAMIFIYLYNGAKGGGGKIMQYSVYLFYPLHMLILYFLFTMM